MSGIQCCSSALESLREHGRVCGTVGTVSGASLEYHIAQLAQAVQTPNLLALELALPGDCFSGIKCSNSSLKYQMLALNWSLLIVQAPALAFSGLSTS